MAEAFIAGMDAYTHGSVRTGKVKAKRRLKLPWYLQSEVPRKGLSGQQLWNAIDAMAARLARGPH